MIPAILTVLAALTICAVAASLTYLLVMELWAATCAQARREFEERPYTWTLRPLAEPVISYFESAGMYGRFEFSSERGAHIVLMPLYTASSPAQREKLLDDLRNGRGGGL